MIYKSYCLNKTKRYRYKNNENSRLENGQRATKLIWFLEDWNASLGRHGNCKYDASEKNHHTIWSRGGRNLAA